MSTGRRRPSDSGRAPVALYRAAASPGKSGSRLRRAAEVSLQAPGLDLAGRFRVFQRALRIRIERREVLLDIVRAVNTSLEPDRICELVVERAGTWVPATCWAPLYTDHGGELS